MFESNRITEPNSSLVPNLIRGLALLVTQRRVLVAKYGWAIKQHDGATEAARIGIQDSLSASRLTSAANKPAKAYASRRSPMPAAVEERPMCGRLHVSVLQAGEDLMMLRLGYSVTEGLSLEQIKQLRGY